MSTIQRHHRRRVRWLHAVSAVLIVLCSAQIAGASDYFVSPGGNDQNDGLSAGRPWRTITRANNNGLLPGDTLSFEGGHTFPGTINLFRCGTDAQLVTVRSYGTGRATIAPSAGNRGIDAYNCQSVTVRDLIVVGASSFASGAAGVSFYVDQINTRYRRVTIDNVDVSGFVTGLLAGGNRGTSGYDGLRVTRVVAHHNQLAGINVWGSEMFAHKDLYIGDSLAYSNLGNPAMAGNSGNGIVVGSVDGGRIERSVAHDNGAQCFARECAAGIWAYDSNRVTIQHSESYNNRTGSGVDGDGFDLDLGVTNSVMQYNYSHGNEGAGYLILQAARGNSGNVVRYNISVNDGAREGYGAIRVFGSVQDLQIYGNTLIVTGGVPGLRMTDGAPAGVRVLNNLIIARNGSPFMTGAAPDVVEGNRFYDGVNGPDPLLNDSNFAGALGDARLLETLVAFRLNVASPIAAAGSDLRAHGIDPGQRDFFGAELIRVAQFSIGAHQAAGPASAPPAPRPPTNVRIKGTGGE